MKKIFADTINELGSNTFLGMSECEKYGMTWGCNEDCPVLQEGKCELYEDVDNFIQNK